MKTLPLADYANLPRSERDAWATTVAQHQSLDDIFHWGRKQSPKIVPADMVKQDEYTHDVLVPIADERWLVYGTT